MDVAEGLLRKSGGSFDVFTPGIFSEYFRSLYFGCELDAKRIQTLRQEFKFADVAREFRLIEDGFTESIVVTYKQANARLGELRNRGPSRETLRSLQLFIVNVYPKAFERLHSSGALEEVAETFFR
jgi:CRISPR-associated endonuclease/helicase Cas3